jgi:Fe-S-cluster containining protein
MEEGLRFECQPGCTKCCDTHGFVYLTPTDLSRIAAHLGMTDAEFETKYVYRTRNLLRLRKPRRSQCSFLMKTGCAIHPVKPAQCRLYPFWPELVAYRDIWDYEGYRKCPGIGKGPLIQIGTAVEIAQEMKTSYPAFYRNT